MTTDAAVVEAVGLDAFYGKSQALFDVELSVAPGTALAVVGRNGAGKTTLLNTICGLPGARAAGTVRLFGKDVSGWPAHRRARSGLAYVPAGARLFRSLSVEQNMRVAAFAARRSHDADASLQLFPQTAEIAERSAGALSGGERQLVGIARAMVQQPQVLVLDEPIEGLSPLRVSEVCEMLSRVRSAGVTVVLTEQNHRVVEAVCTHVAVLEKGRLVATGTPAEVDARAYLGI